ncbi:hypothetical protein, partial [Frankia sp. CiP3]
GRSNLVRQYTAGELELVAPPKKPGPRLAATPVCPARGCFDIPYFVFCARMSRYASMVRT